MTEPVQPDPAAPAAPAAPDAPAEDLAARAASLEAELAKVRADIAAAGGDMVQLKVEGEHEALQVGHIVIGTEYTPVPAAAVPAIMEGAANSGVTVTQEVS